MDFDHFPDHSAAIALCCKCCFYFSFFPRKNQPVTGGCGAPSAGLDLEDLQGSGPGIGDGKFMGYHIPFDDRIKFVTGICYETAGSSLCGSG